jgi:hypothetical protein
MLFALLRINIRKRASRFASASLSERYQLDENIQALRTLLPMLTAYALLFGFYQICVATYLTVHSRVSFSQSDYAIFAESVNVIPLYYLALPIIFYYFHKSLRLRIRQALHAEIRPALNENEGYGVEDDRVITARQQHYRTLADMWDSGNR